VLQHNLLAGGKVRQVLIFA